MAQKPPNANSKWSGFITPNIANYVAAFGDDWEYYYNKAMTIHKRVTANENNLTYTK